MHHADQVDQHLEYHRLARSWPRYRWWKPLVTGILGLAIYIVFAVALLLVLVVIAVATSTDMQQFAEVDAAIDLSDPVIFAVTLASLILMIPALVLATLIIGPRPIGLLSSVVGRLRWRWLGLCTGVSVGIYAVSFVITGLMGELLPAEAAPLPQPDTSTMLILLALTLLAVPFQAAAEEYVFRGYLMQLVGGWLKHPAFAILLPVPLFVIAHLYDPFGQASIAAFAIFAGWITWRTGGLEAAIAVHAINNMSIFALGAFGLADVNATEGSLSGLVVSFLTLAVTAFVIAHLADRRGIQRTRTVTPVPAAPVGWAPSVHQPLGRDPGQRRPAPFPAGDGVWHEAAPTPSRPWSSSSRPNAPLEPSQHDPARHDPAQYEPTQYEPGEYPRSSEDRPVRNNGNASRNAFASPSPASSGQPQRDPFSGSPDHSENTPHRPTSPAPGDGRHPAGAVFPPGPGYPAGTSHPPGPGFPPAVDVAPDGSDRAHKRAEPTRNAAEHGE